MSEDEPYLPPRNLSVERALGRFIIAWGALEGEIDSAIHDLMRTHVGTGVIVTANLAIRAKLDLAHALFEEMRALEDDPIWYPISPEWEARFDALVNQTAKANAESRIPIVHSQPQVIHLESGDRPIWVRMVARKGGWRATGVTYTKAYLDRQTATVVSLLNEWGAVRAHWKHSIYAMRLADADELQSRLPGEEDRLTLQIRSSPDSPPPKPKQPRKLKLSQRQKREARRRGE